MSCRIATYAAKNYDTHLISSLITQKVAYAVKKKIFGYSRYTNLAKKYLLEALIAIGLNEPFLGARYKRVFKTALVHVRLYRL